MFYRRYIIYRSDNNEIKITNNSKFIGNFLGEFSADLKNFNGIFYIGDIPISVTDNKIIVKKSIPNIYTLKTKLFIKNIFYKTEKQTIHYSKYQFIHHNINIKNRLVKEKTENWASKFNKERSI